MFTLYSSVENGKKNHSDKFLMRTTGFSGTGMWYDCLIFRLTSHFDIKILQQMVYKSVLHGN